MFLRLFSALVVNRADYLMSCSCHLERASNDEISVECLYWFFQPTWKADLGIGPDWKNWIGFLNLKQCTFLPISKKVQKLGSKVSMCIVLGLNQHMSFVTGQDHTLKFARSSRTGLNPDFYFFRFHLPIRLPILIR